MRSFKLELVKINFSEVPCISQIISTFFGHRQNQTHTYTHTLRELKFKISILNRTNIYIYIYIYTKKDQWPHGDSPVATKPKTTLAKIVKGPLKTARS